MVTAMFVAIAAASSAMAQNQSINFDGKTSNISGPALNALTTGPNSGYEIPLPQAPGVEPVSDQLPPCDQNLTLTWPFPCSHTLQIPPNCNQTGNSWWWVAVCGESFPLYAQPVYLGAPYGADSKASPTKEPGKRHLIGLILGYANTYPEFAAAILPIFNDKKMSVVYDSKGAYLISGKTIARLDFTKLSQMTPAASTVSQNKIAPALEVGLLVAENIAAWYSVYQTWNSYHSSDNSTDSGSDGANNGGNAQPNTHQSDYNIQHNLQRIRTAR